MPKLKRGLGFWSSVAIAIGGMIGAGVFVLLGIGAGIAGSALPIAFLIAGALAFCNAASAAELGASFPVSGATYEYAHRLISPRVGFLTGFIFSVSKLLESATVALSFGLYFALFFGVSARAVALATVAAFTALTYFGIRITGDINNVFVLIKVAILAILIFLAASYVMPSNLSGFAQSGAGNVLTASALLFFAYTGYARISTLGEEIKDPKRNIPRATLVALVITTAIYLLVSVIAIGVVGSGALAKSSSPLALVAAKVSPALAALVTFGALVATASVLLGDLLAASRTMFAMGRRRELPGVLGAVSERYGVPYASQIIAGVVVFAVVAIGNLSFSAFLTSLTILFYYVVTNLSALRLKAKRLLFPRFMSVLGVIGCVVLAFFVPLQEWIATAAVLLIGFAYYQVKKL